MFSVEQKRSISRAVQTVIKSTNHPELPEGEINFSLHVEGAGSGSWADIMNNGRCPTPDVNPHNEQAGGLRVIALTGEQWEALQLCQCRFVETMDSYRRDIREDFDGLHRALYPEMFE